MNEYDDPDQSHLGENHKRLPKAASKSGGNGLAYPPSHISEEVA